MNDKLSEQFSHHLVHDVFHSRHEEALLLGTFFLISPDLFVTTKKIIMYLPALRTDNPIMYTDHI